MDGYITVCGPALSGLVDIEADSVVANESAVGVAAVQSGLAVGGAAVVSGDVVATNVLAGTSVKTAALTVFGEKRARTTVSNTGFSVTTEPASALDVPAAATVIPFSTLAYTTGLRSDVQQQIDDITSGVAPTWVQTDLTAIEANVAALQTDVAALEAVDHVNITCTTLTATGAVKSASGNISGTLAVNRINIGNDVFYDGTALQDIISAKDIVVAGVAAAETAALGVTLSAEIAASTAAAATALTVHSTAQSITELEQNATIDGLANKVRYISTDYEEIAGIPVAGGNTYIGQTLRIGSKNDAPISLYSDSGRINCASVSAAYIDAQDAVYTKELTLPVGEDDLAICTDSDSAYRVVTIGHISGNTTLEVYSNQLYLNGNVNIDHGAAITGKLVVGKNLFGEVGNITLDPVAGSVRSVYVIGDNIIGTNVVSDNLHFDTILNEVTPTEFACLEGVTSAVQTQIDAKAPLASPALTGTPTAPTPFVYSDSTQIATTAFVWLITGTKAPLDSPVFTGTPTAPTPGDADASTRLATTAYVQTNVVPKAPKDSPAFYGTPTAPTPPYSNNSTRLATTEWVWAQSYATLASPALTGVPTAPTAAAANNTTQLATTAYADRAGTNGGTAATTALLAADNVWTGTNEFQDNVDINGGLLNYDVLTYTGNCITSTTACTGQHTTTAGATTVTLNSLTQGFAVETAGALDLNSSTGNASLKAPMGTGTVQCSGTLKLQSTAGAVQIYGNAGAVTVRGNTTLVSSITTLEINALTGLTACGYSADLYATTDVHVHTVTGQLNLTGHTNVSVTSNVGNVSVDAQRNISLLADTGTFSISGNTNVAVVCLQSSVDIMATSQYGNVNIRSGATGTVTIGGTTDNNPYNARCEFYSTTKFVYPMVLSCYEVTTATQYFTGSDQPQNVFISYAGVSTLYLGGTTTFTNGMRILIRKIGVANNFIVARMGSPTDGMCARGQCNTANYTATITIGSGQGFCCDLVYYNGTFFDTG